jgi:hypothetical protein
MELVYVHQDGLERNVNTIVQKERMVRIVLKNVNVKMELNVHQKLDNAFVLLVFKVSLVTDLVI